MDAGYVSLVQSHGALALWSLDDISHSDTTFYAPGDSSPGTKAAMRATSAPAGETGMQRTTTWGSDGWAFFECWTEGYGMKVYLDGVLQDSFNAYWGGQHNVSVQVPSGSHTLKITVDTAVGSNHGVASTFCRRAFFGNGNTIFETWDFSAMTAGALPGTWTGVGATPWVIGTWPNPQTTMFNNSYNQWYYSKDAISGQLYPYGGWDNGTTGSWFGSSNNTGKVYAKASADFLRTAYPTMHFDVPPNFCDYEWSVPWSAECWFIADTYSSGFSAILTKIDQTSTVGWQAGLVSSTALGFYLMSPWASNRIGRQVTISLNAWYHLVCVNDGTGLGTGLHIYLNGVEPAYNAPMYADVGSLSAVSIRQRKAGLMAAGKNSNAEMFDGRISNVAVYPSALTTNQIASHYGYDAVYPIASTNNSLAAHPHNITRRGPRNLVKATTSSTGKKRRSKLNPGVD